MFFCDLIVFYGKRFFMRKNNHSKQENNQSTNSGNSHVHLCQLDTSYTNTSKSVPSVTTFTSAIK